MDGKNIPPFITLSAALIACMICILRGASLYTTLKIVLLVMLIFFIIGCSVQKILVKIDHDAEEAALERQRIEQELAAKELAESELKQKTEGSSEEATEAKSATTENIAENVTKNIEKEEPSV